MTKIIDVEYFINNISVILNLIVPGFFFIMCYNHVSGITPKTTKNTFLYSIAFSSLFKILLSKFCDESKTPKRFFVLMVLLSVLLGYLLGRFVLTKSMNQIALKLKIRRTTNSNIWNDIMQSGRWYRVYLKGKNDVYYEGQIVMIEEQEHFPFIVMDAFTVTEIATNKEIENYNEYSKNRQNDPNEHYQLMLNTEDIDKIILIDTNVKSK